MTTLNQPQRPQAVIGVDVGGTKCSAGLVILPAGNVLARRLQPTRPDRGGQAVLSDVVEMVQSLQRAAVELNVAVASVGIGVAELVDLEGNTLSEATIQWKGLPVSQTVAAEVRLPTFIEADVRAAARGEACLGAGRRFQSFLYITIGTGISTCYVLDGLPHAGTRGLTGTFASSRGLIPADNGELVSGPPLEQFAAGPALAARYAAVVPDFAGTTFDLIALAESGNPLARSIVSTSGEAVGAAVAHLVNVLDPEAVVVGGGLGLVGGVYRRSIETTLHAYVWSDIHRQLPLLSAELGQDAGFVGAALFASNR